MLKKNRLGELVLELVLELILRSTEIKFEITESKLSLLLKHNIIMSRNTVVSSYTYNHSAIKIIEVLK